MDNNPCSEKIPSTSSASPRTGLFPPSTNAIISFKQNYAIPRSPAILRSPHTSNQLPLIRDTKKARFQR
ncbi:hypothetical protein [Rubritalea tangerina]|uniref:hypothetical protein n=1 Tax=Rubritalea tangerina TaxID=430798 RepID=UPI00361D74B8